MRQLVLSRYFAGKNDMNLGLANDGLWTKSHPPPLSEIKFYWNTVK